MAINPAIGYLAIAIVPIFTFSCVLVDPAFCMRGDPFCNAPAMLLFGSGSQSGSSSSCASYPYARVSVTSAGLEATGGSDANSVSATGRYIAFQSSAPDLVSGDSNGAIDIFLHDRETGIVKRVSVDSNGTEANGSSFQPSISGDGRFIAFQSSASNLVVGDGNGVQDIFVHDAVTAVTERISVSSGGVEGGNNSTNARISSDGRHVAFQSTANNLVGGDTNGFEDSFVRDRQLGTTVRVSVATGGAEATGGASIWPSISGDGRYVAFASGKNNLIAGDSNGAQDIFVHDLQGLITERVSVSSAGVQAGAGSVVPSISPDGNRVTFQSSANNLIASDANGFDDVFLRDRQAGTTILVSQSTDGTQGNSGSGNNSRAGLSTDGSVILFSSAANNLVSGDSNAAMDVFVRKLATQETLLVSRSKTGAQGLTASQTPSLSHSCNYAAFHSTSGNLVDGDTNGIADVFFVPFL